MKSSQFARCFVFAPFGNIWEEAALQLFRFDIYALASRTIRSNSVMVIGLVKT